MSDVPVGWAELISAPLGPEPCDDTPLAALPYLFDLERLALLPPAASDRRG